MSWFSKLISWLLPGSVLTPAPPPVPVHPVTTAVLIAHLNVERVTAGLEPLIESPALDASALAWAKSMAKSGVLSHGNFARRLSVAMPGHSAAEDIAEGQTTVTEVVDDWMASPGHRANILGPYTLVGHGEATANNGTVYWVVDFAS